jgi:hypothetical protein
LGPFSDLCNRFADLLLQNFQHHAERLGKEVLGSSEFAQSIGSFSAETVELANQVQLMQASTYESANDVLDVGDEWLNEQLQRLSDGFGFQRESLASRLASPTKRFEFSVPVSLVSKVDLEVAIGGANDLRLTSSPISAERWTIVLSGSIEAISVNRAIRGIERHFRSLIGLSVASGIGRLLRGIQTWESVRAKIDSEGVSYNCAIHPSVATLAATMFGIADSAEVIDFSTGAIRDEHVHRAQESLRRISQVVASEDPVHLHSSALLFADAIASPIGAQSIAIAFMSLEALLLDDSKRDLLARLAEAVAYRLGTSSESRSALRKQVGKLYDQRSSYVHKGTVAGDGPSSAEMLSLTARAIKKELDELRPPTATNEIV